jgi:hypothetical protein
MIFIETRFKIFDSHNIIMNHNFTILFIRILVKHKWDAKIPTEIVAKVIMA